MRFVAEPHGLAPVWIALSKRPDRSHLLWTDDDLAAFAQVMPATLVSLDRKVAKRYPSVVVEVPASTLRGHP